MGIYMNVNMEIHYQLWASGFVYYVNKASQFYNSLRLARLLRWLSVSSNIVISDIWLDNYLIHSKPAKDSYYWQQAEREERINNM